MITLQKQYKYCKDSWKIFYLLYQQHCHSVQVEKEGMYFSPFVNCKILCKYMLLKCNFKAAKVSIKFLLQNNRQNGRSH